MTHKWKLHLKEVVEPTRTFINLSSVVGVKVLFQLQVDLFLRLTLTIKFWVGLDFNENKRSSKLRYRLFIAEKYITQQELNRC